MDWSKFIVQVGVPSAIALWLVYSVTTDIKDEIRSTSRAMTAHTLNTDTLMRNTDEMNKALIQICVNTAKNAKQSSACLGMP